MTNLDARLWLARIPNPLRFDSRISNLESRISNLESRIPNPESRIPNPERFRLCERSGERRPKWRSVDPVEAVTSRSFESLQVRDSRRVKLPH